MGTGDDGELADVRAEHVVGEVDRLDAVRAFVGDIAVD